MSRRQRQDIRAVAPDTLLPALKEWNRAPGRRVLLTATGFLSVFRRCLRVNSPPLNLTIKQSFVPGAESKWYTLGAWDPEIAQHCLNSLPRKHNTGSQASLANRVAASIMFAGRRTAMSEACYLAGPMRQHTLHARSGWICVFVPGALHQTPA